MAENKYITVPNLSKWQHYKDRCPPWIKLHRDVLNDYKFSCLPDQSKAHLLLIWVLASQMDNMVPFDSKWLAGKIGASTEIDLDHLISKRFLDVITDDSNMIADCEQDNSADLLKNDSYAIAETEAETELLAKKETICMNFTSGDFGKKINKATGEVIE